MKRGFFLSIFFISLWLMAGVISARAGFTVHDAQPVTTPAKKYAPLDDTASISALIKKPPAPLVKQQALPPIPRHPPRVRQVSAARPSLQIIEDDAPLPVQEAAGPVTHILVHKSERKMYLLNAKGQIVHTYTIALGWAPEGKKTQQGDGRTPEGHYKIDLHNDKSKYYRSLRISYPSKKDIRAARRSGVLPGGDIFIHGRPNGKSWMWWKYGKGRDWTDGCIAVTDDEIDQIWALVPDGTPIDISS